MADKLKEWIHSFPVEVRDHLIKTHTGSNLPYIMKAVYTAPPGEEPKFKAKIAIGLDKASRGKLDFRDYIDSGWSIDWNYVKRRLGKSKHLTDAGDSD